MALDGRKMGRYLLAAGTAMAFSLSAAIGSAQSRGDDGWAPAGGSPGVTRGAAPDDGWTGRDAGGGDPVAGYDNGARTNNTNQRPADNRNNGGWNNNGSSNHNAAGNQHAPARNGDDGYGPPVGRSNDRSVTAPRAGSPGYVPRQDSDNGSSSGPARQAQPYQMPAYRGDPRSQNSRQYDGNGRPIPAAYQSSAGPNGDSQQPQQHSVMHGNGYYPDGRPMPNQSRPYYNGNNYSGNNYNNYNGYRGPQGRLAMQDTTAHSVMDSGQPAGGEMMPPGAHATMMPGQMSGHMQMEEEGMPGPEWSEGPEGGPGCGCGGGPDGGGSCEGACGGNGCGGNCCGCCSCGPLCRLMNNCMCSSIFDYLSVNAGVDAFRQPLDVAFNGTKGNFGFDEGVNWGIPITEGFAGQVGGNFVHSDLTEEDFSHRNEIFFTAAMFYRAAGDCGFQGGLAFDYMHDDWSDVYSNIGLEQLRGNVSYVMNCNQFGFRFATGLNTTTPHINEIFRDQPGIVESGAPIRAADIYAVYYARQFRCGGQGDIWAGVANGLGAVVGADFSMPLSDSLCLDTGFTYVIPRDSSNTVTDYQDASLESWNIGMNLVWRPFAHRCCRSNDCCDGSADPLFDVANNGSFLMRAPLTNPLR